MSWKDGVKTIRLKSATEVVSLKATNSLFVRLMLIAKSSRDLDLEDIVCKHEFSHFNATFMKRDGSLLPSSNKSQLAHELERMAADTSVDGNSITSTSSESTLDRDISSERLHCIIIDGMAIVHELSIHKDQIKKCHDLATYFIQAVNNKYVGYCEAYILFDNYSTNSLKDHTRHLRTAGRTSDRGYTVEDITPI